MEETNTQKVDQTERVDDKLVRKDRNEIVGLKNVSKNKHKEKKTIKAKPKTLEQTKKTNQVEK